MRTVLGFCILTCAVCSVLCQTESETEEVDCSEPVKQYHRCMRESKDAIHREHIQRKQDVNDCFNEFGCTLPPRKMKKRCQGPDAQEYADYKPLIAACFHELVEQKVSCVQEQYPDYSHHMKHHHRGFRNHSEPHFHLCQLYNPLVCPDAIRSNVTECLQEKGQQVLTELECDNKKAHKHHYGHQGRHHHHDQQQAGEEQGQRAAPYHQIKCQLKADCLAKMSDECQNRYKSMRAVLCECSKTAAPADLTQLQCLQDEQMPQIIKDKIMRKLTGKQNFTPKSCIDKCDPNFLAQKAERKLLKKAQKNMKKAKKGKKARHSEDVQVSVEAEVLNE